MLRPVYCQSVESEAKIESFFGRVFHTVAVDSGQNSDTVRISALTALTWNGFLFPHARVVAMTPSFVASLDVASRTHTVLHTADGSE